MITPTNKVIYNQSSINIEFKKNNSYDLLYVSTKQAGFTSSKILYVHSYNISLDEESAHEQIFAE